MIQAASSHHHPHPAPAYSRQRASELEVGGQGKSQKEENKKLDLRDWGGGRITGVETLHLHLEIWE